MSALKYCRNNGKDFQYVLLAFIFISNSRGKILLESRVKALSFIMTFRCKNLEYQKLRNIPSRGFNIKNIAHRLTTSQERVLNLIKESHLIRSLEVLLDEGKFQTFLQMM